MLRTLTLGTLALLLLPTHAQINGYAQVTSITDSICYIGASNESVSSFAVGKQVVIMQMQDDVIGENTFNNAQFGSVGTIGSAGAYSIREIIALERSGALLTSVTLDRPPGVEFNTGANSTVQMITYERLGGGGDFTTTSNIGAISWNGSLGGVIAFFVEGTLNLEHNIVADAVGFRGGARTTSNEGSCNSTNYIYDQAGPDADRYASKGEGIYRAVGSAWAKGRGPILNGGGGGNGNNGGGGGGSNFTSGGNGGAGFGCSGDPSGGLGGVPLGSYANSTRLYMGGGGGGGEGNGSSSSVGMRGGGIILIKADVVKTNGACAQRLISANGGNANASGSDGAGGGGAGGTIMLHVSSFDMSSGCPLTIRANGGNGGSVNDPTDHGGGAGGGQGALYFKGMVPILNVITQTNNGIGGCNSNSMPCTSQAGNGGGSNGAGISYYEISPLPVELVAFNAMPQKGVVELFWSTATESDNQYFVVQRSADGVTWAPIHRESGAGQSSSPQSYNTTDQEPLPGSSFYRLVQVASSGSPTYSHMVAIHMHEPAHALVLFPNPAADRIAITTNGSGVRKLRILNELGQGCIDAVVINSPFTDVDISSLKPGVYIVALTGDGPPTFQKLMVQR